MTFRLSNIAFAIGLMVTLGAAGVPAQTYNTLVNFDGTNGARPQYVALVQGLDGSFYGTSYFAGKDVCFISELGRLTCGLVFKMTPSGTLTTVHKFENTDGAFPAAGLVSAADGYFYGTTEGGGTDGRQNEGTIFRMSPKGDVTTLYTFEGAAAGCPFQPLVQGMDGDLYGTTGCFGNGTIFKITQSGVLATLYNFCSQPNCADGWAPQSPLVQGLDGNLYGTTVAGGAACASTSGCGTIYRITPQGVLTTLHAFNGTDGTDPSGALVLTSDGNLYGTTVLGGDSGTVFRFNVGTRTLTTLHSFSFSIDGANPGGGVVRGSDGNFYGTTYQGSPDLGGTIFQITPRGVVTTLHNFSGNDGAHCFGALLQGTDGAFYGVTYDGGTFGLGTVFSISVGLGPFVKTNPDSGKAGASIKILGTNLTGATAVTFNGVPASFTVNASGSAIFTTVPAEATTGQVEVSTPGGPLLSSGPFIVR